MLKVKPIKIKPIQLVKKDFSLLPKGDKDFDSLPDHLDCNPRNPLQQDNGSIKRLPTPFSQIVPYNASPANYGQIVPHQPQQDYISPQAVNELSGSTLPDTSQAIDADYTETIDFDDEQFAQTEAEELKKVQYAYQKAHGPRYILFLLKRDGTWTRTPTKFINKELDFNDEAKIAEMLKDPNIVNYTLSQDQYFADRQNMKRDSRQQQLSAYKRNIQQALKPSQMTERQKQYAIGPSSLPRQSLYGRKSPSDILGNYSSQFRKAKYPDEVMLSYDQEPASPSIDTDFKVVPPGFQEQSPFPLHVPYRPIRLPFVQKPKRFPMFRPPFLR